MPGKQFSKLAFWVQLGPLFLLGAAAAIFLQFHLWDCLLFSLSFVGIFCIRRWEGWGFLCACGLLAACEASLAYAGEGSVVLPLCIACSWWLTLIGHKSGIALLRTDEEVRNALETQISEMTAQRRVEQSKSRQEIDRLTEQLNAARVENGELLNKMAEQSETITRLLKSEADAQIKLAAAQYHYVVLQNTSVIEENVEDKMLPFQHALLREQFEEKSDVLDKTRRDLFLTETELFALKKERELQGCESPDLEFEKMAQALCAMQEHAETLEDLITLLTASEKEAVKKVRKPRKLKSQETEEQGLPFLLQQKIETVNEKSTEPS